MSPILQKRGPQYLPPRGCSQIRLSALRVDNGRDVDTRTRDRKSTRLNSSHGYISYAVFCLKKKKIITLHPELTRTAAPVVLAAAAPVLTFAERKNCSRDALDNSAYIYLRLLSTTQPADKVD